MRVGGRRVDERLGSLTPRSHRDDGCRESLPTTRWRVRFVRQVVSSIASPHSCALISLPLRSGSRPRRALFLRYRQPRQCHPGNHTGPSFSGSGGIRTSGSRLREPMPQCWMQAGLRTGFMSCTGVSALICTASCAVLRRDAPVGWRFPKSSVAAFSPSLTLSLVRSFACQSAQEDSTPLTRYELRPTKRSSSGNIFALYTCTKP